MTYKKHYPKKETWIDGKLVKYFYSLASYDDVKESYKRSHKKRGQIPIFEYDRAKSLVAIHDSISAASKKTGIDMSNISKVKDLDNRTAGNRIWKTKMI